MRFEDADSIAIYIDQQKLELSIMKMKNNQQYSAMSITEQVVHNLGKWKDGDSELTPHRRFAAILDILLGDIDITMVDDKHSSESTNMAIDMSKNLFGVQNQTSA